MFWQQLGTSGPTAGTHRSTTEKHGMNAQNGSQRKFVSYEQHSLTIGYYRSQRRFPEENTMQNKSAKPTSISDQGSFCYLLSCTNAALILLSQFRAFEHLTFVFLVALQDFRLQTCTDRIGVPPPAGKTRTERCVKGSFHPLTTTLLVAQSLILCWSHLALRNKETSKNRDDGNGLNDQQCLSAEKSRVLSRKKEHVLSRLVWKALTQR